MRISVSIGGASACSSILPDGTNRTYLSIIMDVIKTAIDGVVIIEPRVFKDARGYFFESFSQREFEEKVHKINFVQDNESMSSYGVMRGLHFNVLHSLRVNLCAV